MRARVVVQKLSFLHRLVSAERESVGRRALVTMGDGVEALCFVKECRELERAFGTKFTEKLLKVVMEFLSNILRRSSSRLVASSPGSSAWVEKQEPGTHCLRMLSSPRISGGLDISVKSASLH